MKNESKLSKDRNYFKVVSCATTKALECLNLYLSVVKFVVNRGYDEIKIFLVNVWSSHTSISLNLNELHLELRVDTLIFDTRNEDNICIFLDGLSLLQHIEAGLDQCICIHVPLDKHAIAWALQDAGIGCASWIADDDYLWERSILTDIASETTDVGLRENNRTV